jgi:hypothetical protein
MKSMKSTKRNKGSASGEAFDYKHGTAVQILLTLFALFILFALKFPAGKYCYG